MATPQATPQAPERRSSVTLIGGVAGVVLLVLVALAFFLGNNSASGGAVPTVGLVVNNGPTRTALPTQQIVALPVTGTQELPGTPMPDEGGNHVPENEIIHYKSNPPSSGPHNPSTAELGFSYKVQPIGRVVHSMEHGAVVIYYRPDLPESDKESLRKLFDQLPRATSGEVKLIVTPYPDLQAPMVLAAWTRLLPLEKFDYLEIFTFYRAWMGKGPEGTP